MKTVLSVSTLIILLTSFTVHAQSPNQSQNLFERSESSDKFRTNESYTVYDSTSLDSFIVAKMEESHIPGVAACIVNDNQVVWQGYYGYANIEENKQVNDSTVFLIASISKLFTATALMQLWENDLFELDDDINDYLPDNLQVVNPNYVDIPITFRMLLSHTSSIDYDSYLINKNILSWGTDCPVPLDSFLVNYFMPEGSYYWMGPFLNFPPGTDFNYTSQAFGLIGYLVEVLADTPFSAYCQQYIFDPLQMRNTAWFLSQSNYELLATPYEYSNNYDALEQYGRPDYPANTLRTSVLELANFLIANIQKGQFQDVKILESNTVDLMTTVQTNDPWGYYGLGWHIIDVEYAFNGVSGPLYYGHDGSFFGFNATMWYNKENKMGTIVLTNGDFLWEMIDIWWEIVKFAQITGIEDVTETILTEFALQQNHPNPFNPSTTIEFTLPKSEFVELKVYNILGKEVTTIVSNKLNQGNHTYQFDGNNLASGVYYYQLMTGDYREVKKMILLR
jgi:CubicO group peptidase (beta-lactamase class C family)